VNPEGHVDPIGGGDCVVNGLGGGGDGEVGGGEGGIGGGEDVAGGEEVTAGGEEGDGEGNAGGAVKYSVRCHYNLHLNDLPLYLIRRRPRYLANIEPEHVLRIY
jgi:hypothetical protein